VWGVASETLSRRGWDLWGDPRRDDDRWTAHPPYDLTPGCAVGLFVSVGSGRPGLLDGPSGSRQGQQIEPSLRLQSVAFLERLRQLGIPVRFDAYDPGTHDWPYGPRELHRSLPLLLNAGPGW
jgi:S-formylglutathione hydrolase FrmB